MSRPRIAVLVALTLFVSLGNVAYLGPEAAAVSFGGNGLLAFARDMPSEDDDNWDLFVVDPLTGLESHLTHRRYWEYDPSWSPDGRWIAYESPFAIYAITPDGRRERLLIERDFEDERGYVQFFGPAWSPDGSKLAYMEATNESKAIKILNLKSGDVQVVAEFPDVWPYDISWSPDGRKIAFEYQQGDNDADIKLLDVGSERITNLSQHLRDGCLEGDHREPVWTPDGRILFSVTPQTCPWWYCYDIYEVHPSGDGLEQVITSPRDFTGDGVFDGPSRAIPSPDGTQLALVLVSPIQENSVSELWILDLASDQMSKVTEGVSFVDAIDWQPRCTVVGTRRDDVLRGTSHRDLICGFGGDDVIYGLGGDDSIFGHRGDDRMVGGPGRDIVVGNTGRDICDDDKTDFSRIC